MPEEKLFMRPLTHHTAVVLIPPEEIWAPIQAIRRDHDRQYRRWMPHITLLYPFLPREDFHEAAPLLERACAGIAPFKVTLGEFRSFHHRGRRYTVWLAPEPLEPLLGLFAALARAFPESAGAPRLPFEPHLSVGQTGRTGLEELVAALQARWQPLSFEAVAVSLIWRHDPPDDVFRVERSFPFATP
jgi:2'-5' RNA ligase